jgi:nucleoporin NUP1
MPILMHSEKDEKPRLGKSKRREVNGSKPYAGEGGMKKLLARRKLEEEDERRKEKAEAMDDEREEEDEVLPAAEKKDRLYNAESTGEKTVSTAEKRQQQNSTPVLTFGSSIDTTASYEKSSLRVGRTRTSRNHISHPASRSNNRFSAVYDEEESDDQMLEVKSADQIASEEAAKKVPAFGVPAGFSFAKEVCF